MAKIEWTEKTWNPIVGCSVVSPGCTNCYAMTMAARLDRMGLERYRGLTTPSKAGPVWTGETRLVEETLTEPLRRRKPTMWFVNSMSDLFHESVPDAWINSVFAVMALCPQHTFQVLTKRPARMRSYLSRSEQEMRAAVISGACALNWFCDQPGDGAYLCNRWPGWPLKNVWLGISAEDQRRADERMPDLLGAPAAVRFVSAEPLLGPIDFTSLSTMRFRGAELLNALTGELQGMFGDPCSRSVPRLDWIIVGKESGHGARWINDDAVRAIRDQCEAAGTAFFYKQDALNGRKIPTPELDGRRWIEMPLLPAATTSEAAA